MSANFFSLFFCFRLTFAFDFPFSFFEDPFAILDWERPLSPRIADYICHQFPRDFSLHFAMADDLRVGVLTVSDTCSRGEAQDKSGPNLKRLVTEAPNLGVQQVLQDCVPDEMAEIKRVLLRWCDEEELHLVLTTGGTGFSPRDITPEATREVIERHAPGLSQCMIGQSLNVTPMAMLSRPVCGIRKKTIIINLPGSLKGSQECFQFVLPALPHAIQVLCGSTKVNALHSELQKEGPCLSVQSQHVCPHKAGKGKIPKDWTRVAERDRHSPYPLVPVNQAMAMIFDKCQSYPRETICAEGALGYVLAADIHAQEPFPPFPASIKDGYAVIASDGPGVRQVLGPVTAGEMSTLKVTPGQVMRITTGAPLPPGADAVVQVEDTELVESADDGRREVKIKILSTPQPGQDIRPVGSDIPRGQQVLSCGEKLGPAELGLLLTLGINKVEAHKKPKVALLSTGNELVEQGVTLTEGQIRDSNKTVLKAVLQREGFEFVDLGISADIPEVLESKLREGLEKADVIVSSGGVSMGEKDLLKPVLENCLGATIHFGRVFMKPGKPATFASTSWGSDHKLLFALPGNPVSALVTSQLFVLPALRKLAGHSSPLPTKIKAKLPQAIELDPRPEYRRVMLSWQPEEHVPVAMPTGSQCSSRLMSMRTANALLVLPPRKESLTRLPAGHVVDALVIGEM